MDTRLEKRSYEILREVVRRYISTGEPVGSRTISKLDRFDFSAATIRNIMADLEELGFLHQPHTSAGRVPTDLGYRYFVDDLMAKQAKVVSRVDQVQISMGMLQLVGEVKEMMRDTSRLLSRITKQVGIVMGPDLTDILFHKMEFILLSINKILVVAISPSGVINNRVIEVDLKFSQEELDHVSRFLADRYEGYTLAAVRDDVVRILTEEEAQCGELMLSSLRLGSMYFDRVGTLSEVFLNGTSNILAFPEFFQTESIQTLLRAIEEKNKLVQLLNCCMSAEGVSTVIGSESEIEDFTSCSLIASRFSYDGRAIGSVGILGPKRMEYPRLIGVVENIAGQFTEMMSQNRDERS